MYHSYGWTKKRILGTAHMFRLQNTHSIPAQRWALSENRVPQNTLDSLDYIGHHHVLVISH